MTPRRFSPPSAIKELDACFVVRDRDGQPEAQHPKSSAIHNNAGRLPHLLTQSGHSLNFYLMTSGLADSLWSAGCNVSMYQFALD